MSIERFVAANDDFPTPMENVGENIVEASANALQTALDGLNTVSTPSKVDVKEVLAELAAQGHCPGFEFPSNKEDLTIVASECTTYYLCRKFFRKTASGNPVCSFTEDFVWGVTVPAGAAADRVGIKAKLEGASRWGQRRSSIFVSRVLNLQPAGHKFAQPITIRLGVDPKSIPAGQTCESLTVLRIEGGKKSIALVRMHFLLSSSL